MKRSYRLEPRFEAFVRQLVESGRYQSIDEVVEAGLRLLQEQEAVRAGGVARLRRLAEEGRLGGLSDEDGDRLLDRLEAEYRAMIRRPPER